MKKGFFVIFLTSINFFLQAETPVSFTLEEAKTYALKHAYEIKNADYDIQSAKKKVWETIAIGLPQIKGEANYTNSLDIATQLFPDFITPAIYDVNENRFGLTPIKPQGDVRYFPVQFGQQFTGNYFINVEQLIFKGSYIVGVQAIKTYLKLTKEMKEKTKIEIKDIVSSAYFNVVVAKENLEVLKQEIKNNQKLLYETKKLYENGFREETDVLQLSLITKNSKTRVIDAKRILIAGKNLLKFVMGIDINDPIEISDKLENFTQDIFLNIPVIENDSFIKTHIDFKYNETNLTAQKYLLKSMYADYLPSISAFYTYRKDAYSDRWNVFKDNWYKSSIIGLHVSMPIFKSGMQKAKIKQQKFTLKKLENESLQLIQRLKKDKIESYNNLNYTWDKFKNDKESLALAKKILNKTKITFKEGISSSTELSQREQQYLQSLNTYIYSTLNLLNAKTTYLKSIGKL